MRQILSPLDGIRSPFGRLMSSTAPFTPAVLFAASEPGVWYDPSDVANLAWRRNLYTQTTNLTNLTNWPTSDNANATRNGAGLSVTTNEGYIYIGRPANSDPVTSGVTYTLSFTAVCNQTIANVPFRMAGALGGTSASTLVNMAAGVSQRISLSITPSTTGNADTRFGIDARNAIVPGGSNDTGYVVTFSDPQFEVGSTATEYQRITDVNTEVVERFPNNTLFQDTAGTTPVTTPGQTVALALDKSKGLVLGSELDDGLSTVANWTVFGTNVVAQDGDAIKITFTTGQPAQGAYQQLRQTKGLTTDLTVGKWYRVAGQAKVNSGSANIQVSTASVFNGPTITATAFTDFAFYFLCDNATTNYLSGGNLSAGEELWLRALSVKELPGFHATQATTASRPIYGINPVGGRRNLLTFTEQFDNAAWTKTRSSITANAGVAPDSTTTADKLVEDTSTNTHILIFATGTSASKTLSMYAKAGERSFLYLETDTSNTATFFNLSTGSVGITGSAVTATISDAGNGWYRCSISGTFAGNGYIGPAAVNGVKAYTGDGTSGILLWGAQLETGSTATAYQKVTTQYDVTEAGVASVSYLAFDGVDDFMVTPTITPGIDKAQIFTGVRKLSDAAVGVIVESSVNYGTNDGSFVTYNQSGSGLQGWGTNSRGTILANNVVTSGYPAPITNVITGLGDISGDRNTLRINGTQVGQITTDQGTGNFLAYPLYIGRRGGTTLPFNGNLYSLIVRFGTNLTTDTITSTETWVAGRTGISI